jgi:hydrogenase maturation protease
MSPLDATLVGEACRPPATADARAPVLVLGVGNLLMGDEGVGVHVLRTLEGGAPEAGVRLLDGGTGGVDLLGDLLQARVVILIDATRDGQPAGTITRLLPKTAGAVPLGLSAHDFGLKDLFAAATLVRAMPTVHLFTISVVTVNPMSFELSAPVAAAVPGVVQAVRALAADLAAPYLASERT